MSLVITQLGSSPLIIFDAEPYLFQEGNAVLDKILEDSAFRRKVEDFQLKASNQDGSFTSLFAGKPATTRFSVKITEGGRTHFIGEIDLKRVEFDPKEETVEMTVFSNLKTFWDRCKESPIITEPRGAEASLVYTTVEYILKREFIEARRQSAPGSDRINIRRFDGLFSNLIIHSDYRLRPIRGWANASTYSDPTIGDNGRYRELAGLIYTPGGSRSSAELTRRMAAWKVAGARFTCYDLLTAFMYHYGAEFYIDYDADALAMHHRNAVINASPAAGGPHDIDSVLLDRESIRVTLLEDDKYDYARIPYHIPPQSAPVNSRLDGVIDTSGLTGNVSYVVTEVFLLEASGTEFEGPPSKPLYVDVKAFIAQEPFSRKSARVLIDVAASTGALRKRVYRTKQGGSDFYLLAEFSSPNVNNQLLDFAGDLLLNQSVVPPSRIVSAAAWVRYDESRSVWDPPIRDTLEGNNQPEGKTIDLVPALPFKEISSDKIKQPSATDVVAFFGLEALSTDFLEKIRRDHIDLFLTKRKVACTVSGVDFKVGDQAVSKRALQPLTGSALMVKRARNYLSPGDRKTELEMITL